MATSDKGGTGRAAAFVSLHTPCIRAVRTRVFEGRIGTDAPHGSVNTGGGQNRPSGVDTKKIRHVRDNTGPRLRVYQQLGTVTARVVS